VITVDAVANAAYIKLSNEQVVETNRVTDDVLVDLDRNRVVVGIEVLSLDAAMPFTILTEQYHVHSTVIDLVRTIRPSVGGFVSTFTHGTDGSASAQSGQLVTADQ
jgi:uncharacterized protein YuzE